ncbi:hypothetical protein [Alteriqipengyuania sp. 357]
MLGFAWGTFTHALDFVTYGWMPYRMAAPAMNAFWNALVFLDAIVLALLVSPWRRIALCAAALLMIGDVGVNSYAAFVLGLEGVDVGVAVQAAFLGFIIGALPFLWPRAERDDRAGPPFSAP